MRGGRAGASLVFAAVLAGAAAADVPKRILVLRSGNFPPYDFAIKGFAEGLLARQIAFTLEDKTLPKADGDVESFMRQVRAGPPDLLLAVGTTAARAAHEMGAGVPFVYCMIVDPLGLGLSGGGAVMETRPSLQFSFIRDNFPMIKRIGVIHSARHNREMVRLLQAEKPADLDLVMIQAETPEDVSNAIQRLSKEADCLLMVSDSVLYSPQTATQIILQTIQNGLPIIAVSPNFVRAGALAGVYPDFRDNGLLAAEAAARFFKGESLADMPILWPTRVLSAVNLIVAKRLNVPVPERTLKAAAEVLP